MHSCRRSTIAAHCAPLHCSRERGEIESGCRTRRLSLLSGRVPSSRLPSATAVTRASFRAPVVRHCPSHRMSDRCACARGSAAGRSLCECVRGGSTANCLKERGAPHLLSGEGHSKQLNGIQSEGGLERTKGEVCLQSSRTYPPSSAPSQAHRLSARAASGSAPPGRLQLLRGPCCSPL